MYVLLLFYNNVAFTLCKNEVFYCQAGTDIHFYSLCFLKGNFQSQSDPSVAILSTGESFIRAFES